METQFFFFKNAYLSVFAVMFCKQFLAYAVHIDCCCHGVHKHSSRFQHIYVNYIYIYASTSLHHWTFIFNTTSGMHRCPFDGQHLVNNFIQKNISLYYILISNLM